MQPEIRNNLIVFLNTKQRTRRRFGESDSWRTSRMLQHNIGRHIGHARPEHATLETNRRECQMSRDQTGYISICIYDVLKNVKVR